MMKTVVVLLFAAVACSAHATYDPYWAWKLVGGKPAAPGQFPYIVSMRLENGTKHNCGGSIISDRWILTAAHCLYKYKPANYTIVAGSNRLNEGGHFYSVEKFVSHPLYRKETGFDIALIKLTKPLALDENVKIIELQRDFINEDEELVLCGWGHLSAAGPLPNELQYVTLTSMTVLDCFYVHDTNELEICTETKSGVGGCYGDSGGPLAFNGKVAGIMSRGYPCAMGTPDIFTRVSAHVDWIIKMMNENM